MTAGSSSPQGRGATGNPANRFDQFHYEPDADADSDSPSAPRTQGPELKVNDFRRPGNGQLELL